MIQKQEKAENWFLDFLENNAGKTGKLIRKKDWSDTPLGKIESWSDSLKYSLRICFATTDRAIAVYWYEPQNNDFYFFFNDNFEIITHGKKDPLGSYASEVWSEVWPDLKIQFYKTLTGEGLSFKKTLFFLDRGGLKEAYFDYNLIPIALSDGKIGGIFNIAFEETDCFLAERRANALKILKFNHISAKDIQEACRFAMENLADFPEDLPVALMYLVDKNKDSASLASSLGLSSDNKPQDYPAIPAFIRLDHTQAPTACIARSVIQSIQGKRLQIIDRLNLQMGIDLHGIFPEPIEAAIVFRLSRHTVHCQDKAEALGVLIIGLSPRLELSDPYLEFLKEIALHIENRIANARSEALAKEVLSLLEME